MYKIDITQGRTCWFPVQEAEEWTSKKTGGPLALVDDHNLLPLALADDEHLRRQSRAVFLVELRIRRGWEKYLQLSASSTEIRRGERRTAWGGAASAAPRGVTSAAAAWPGLGRRAWHRAARRGPAPRGLGQRVERGSEQPGDGRWAAWGGAVRGLTTDKRRAGRP